MALIAPTAFKAYHANITVTGATGVATPIFDATSAPNQGDLYWWRVKVQNLDADAGDTAFIGFTAAVDTADGYQLNIYAAGADTHQVELIVPPHTVIYANCTNAETRDLRLIATPYIP